MASNKMKLYHSPVRPTPGACGFFFAEKGLSVPLATVDLGKRELTVPPEHATIHRWYQAVSSHPTAAA
jgi:hypothetical protein